MSEQSQEALDQAQIVEKRNHARAVLETYGAFDREVIRQVANEMVSEQQAQSPEATTAALEKKIGRMSNAEFNRRSQFNDWDSIE